MAMDQIEKIEAAAQDYVAPPQPMVEVPKDRLKRLEDMERSFMAAALHMANQTLELKKLNLAVARRNHKIEAIKLLTRFLLENGVEFDQVFLNMTFKGEESPNQISWQRARIPGHYGEWEGIGRDRREAVVELAKALGHDLS